MVFVIFQYHSFPTFVLPVYAVGTGCPSSDVSKDEESQSGYGKGGKSGKGRRGRGGGGESHREDAGRDSVSSSFFAPGVCHAVSKGCLKCYRMRKKMPVDIKKVTSKPG